MINDFTSQSIHPSIKQSINNSHLHHHHHNTSHQTNNTVLHSSQILNQLVLRIPQNRPQDNKYNAEKDKHLTASLLRLPKLSLAALRWLRCRRSEEQQIRRQLIGQHPQSDRSSSTLKDNRDLKDVRIHELTRSYRS